MHKSSLSQRNISTKSYIRRLLHVSASHALRKYGVKSDTILQNVRIQSPRFQCRKKFAKIQNCEEFTLFAFVCFRLPIAFRYLMQVFFLFDITRQKTSDENEANKERRKRNQMKRIGQNKSQANKSFLGAEIHDCCQASLTARFSQRRNLIPAQHYLRETNIAVAVTQ